MTAPAPLRLGLVYDTFDAFEWRDGDPPDADAELEPEATVEALSAAFEHLGCTVVRLGTPRQLLGALPRLMADPAARLNAAFSIAEGRDGLGREGHAPSLLDLAGVPVLGADALTLSASLDKAWTKTLVEAAGVRTIPGRAVASADEARACLAAGALPPFPLFVKPRFEGSSKGITAHSLVHTPEALVRQVAWAVATYRQEALVEAFVAGPEFTVAVAGHAPARALPALQRALEADTGIGLHALEHRGLPERAHAWRLDAKALTPHVEAALQQQAVAAFHALRCRDVARFDFRLDTDGEPVFLEANPLPTFDPAGTFGILAELDGVPYETWLARLFADAFDRLGLGHRIRRPG